MNLQLAQELVQRYLQFADADPVTPAQLGHLEAQLNVVLPEDLKLIASVYSGGRQIGGLSIEKILADEPYGDVASCTHALRRSIQLPDRYLVLAEPPESLVVFETKAQATIETPVIWLASYDVDRLRTGEPLRDADLFESYSEFFAFLLDRELEERDDHSEEPGYIR